MPKRIPMTDHLAWKGAITTRLAEHDMSRYAFVRRAVEERICTQHTAECLLADPDTSTGQRVPSLQTAIQFADLAGYDLVLVPKRKPGIRGRQRVTAGGQQ